MVPWQLPVLLGLGTMAINPILLKRATSLPSRTRRILWQFGFAACFSLILALATGAPLDVRAIRGTLLLASGIWTALLLWFWAQQLAPITVVQPIKQVAEMVIPTMIGLTVFKEGAELGIGGYTRFAIGIAGCVVILAVF